MPTPPVRRGRVNTEESEKKRSKAHEDNSARNRHLGKKGGRVVGAKGVSPQEILSSCVTPLQASKLKTHKRHPLGPVCKPCLAWNSVR